MLFKKKNEYVLNEQPLKYWEKESFMSVIPKGGKLDEFVPGILERLTLIEGIQIKESKLWDKNKPGSIKIVYEDEEYEIGFYPKLFAMSEDTIRKYTKGHYYFSNEEIANILEAKETLVIFMKFNQDAKKSYHLQLKIAVAMIPNLLGVYDESAEVILPPKYVNMTASSNVKPGPEALYVIQSVINEKGEIWLHTHGLCRCGITELEILQSDKENYNNHYNVIRIFASYLLDMNNYFNIQEVTANIGMLINKEPIVVTCVPWTKGLKEYDKKLNMGNITDRENQHNSKTSLIFIYKNKKDEINKKYSKVSEYNNLWGNNPLFYISAKETERMKALAIERFYLLKEVVDKKENRINIKFDISVDSKDNLEHLWGELIGFDEDKFKVIIQNEPYYIKDIHSGDVRWVAIESITDWEICTTEFIITPATAYLLIK